MPEAVQPPAGGLPICAAASLAERGRAVVFDVLLWGQPARAFVLRHDGVLRGYINRCAHVPVEMDWQPGHFLDMDKQFIICSIHGASYDPAGGRCVGGRLRAWQADCPAGGGRGRTGLLVSFNGHPAGACGGGRRLQAPTSRLPRRSTLHLSAP